MRAKKMMELIGLSESVRLAYEVHGTDYFTRMAFIAALMYADVIEPKDYVALIDEIVKDLEG